MTRQSGYPYRTRRSLPRIARRGQHFFMGMLASSPEPHPAPHNEDGMKDDEGNPRKLKASCCIAGGGPAGMMLGFLLARMGNRSHCS